ncbi:MAG: hypothetical protein GXY79_01640, partial [Chloroflexi bacterium]|nr:hypothetical protein [Chloroflexota bacterium]
QAEVRIVHLQLEDTVLELFHYRTPQGRPPRPDARQSDLGLTHIGFLVSDLDEMQGRLQQRGVRWLGETVEIRPGVRVAYLYGAEGEVCELREIREAPKEAGGTIS